MDAQANSIAVAAKAQQNYDNIAKKSADNQASFADKIAKAQNAVAVANKSANEATASKGTKNALESATERVSKTEAATVIAADKAWQNYNSTIQEATLGAKQYQEQIVKQQTIVATAARDAELIGRQARLTIAKQPDTPQGQVTAERSANRAADALAKQANEEKKLATLKGEADQFMISSSVAVEQAAISEGARIAAAEQSAQAATITASEARQAVAQSEAVAKEAAAAKVVAANIALETTEAQAAAAFEAGEAQMAAAANAGSVSVEAAKVKEIALLKEAEVANVNVAKTASQMGPIAKTALTGVAVAGVATVAVVTKLGLSYNIAKEAAQTAFTGILHDAPKATAFVEELYAWTRKTSLGFDVATHSAQEFIARGFKIKDVIPTLEIIANAAAALPAPMEQSMQRISYAIGQMQQSAKLHSQDVRQLTEAGIDAWGMLSKATGASIDEMQKDAEKFGLTGPRVAQIILAGMKESSSGLLELQAQTARGQLSIASRNISELSGVFTQPIFDGFKKGLIEVNNLLKDPAVITAAGKYGQSIADGITLAVKPIGLLLASLKQVDDFVKKIPSPSGGKFGGILDVAGKLTMTPTPGNLALAGAQVLAQDTPAAIPLDIFRGYKIANNFGLAPDLPTSKVSDRDNLRNLQSDLARLEQQKASLESQLTGGGGNLRQQLQAGRGQLDTEGVKSELASLSTTINEKSKDIDKLKSSIDSAGQSANNATSGVSNLTKSFQDLLDEAKAGASAAEARLVEAKKVGPSEEQLQNKLAQLDLKIAQTPEREQAKVDTRNIERDAKSAAEASRKQVQTIDDNITAMNREIEARDRAAARQDIVTRLNQTGSEKAQASLTAFDRAVQRAALSAGPTASQKLSESFDAANQAMQRGDLVQAVTEAGQTGRKESKSKQRAEAVARAQEALHRFDIQVAQKEQLEAVKAAETRKKQQEEIAKLDKEDKITKLKEAENKKKQTDDLKKFDADTAEKNRIQKLQDQRDKIQHSAEDTARNFDLAKQAIQDHVQLLDNQKEKLVLEGENIADAIDHAKTFAEIASNLTKPTDEIVQDFTNIGNELKTFYGLTKDLNTKLAKEKASVTTGQEQQLVIEGARAAGGAVRRGKWYMVGEHGPEPFMPNENGMIFPNNSLRGNGTNNNQRYMTNLGPIHVYMNGKPDQRDPLDILFQRY